MINLFYGEKHSFIEWTYVVGAHWNCLYEAIPMCTNKYVTEIKDTHFEIYTKQVSCTLAFLFNISNCQSVTTWQIVDIYMTANLIS